MTLALTLATPSGSSASLLLSDIAHHIAPHGIQSWLAQGEALDVITPHEDQAALSERTLSTIGDAPVDFCIQPNQSRKKRMLIADMDSTIIRQECLDEMAEVMGIKPQIAELTERAMRGELDFEAALRERIQLLAGFTKADLTRVLDTQITLNPGARALVRTMAAHGAHTILVSGGFTDFTTVVATRAGFAKNRANTFIWQDDKLSGLTDPILGREAKLTALDEECAGLGFTRAEVLAVGDGANDLAMLGAAGLGVAYYAKPVVAAQTAAQVRHTDLTTLLYYQGYKRGEFVVD